MASEDLKTTHLGACLAFLLLGVAAILSACALFRPYTLPPAFNPKRPTAADFPDAGVAIVEDMATLEFTEMGGRTVAVLDHRRRMKVLRPSGLEAADVTLPIDAFSTVTRVVGRSVAANGHEERLAQSAVRIVPRTQPNEQAPQLKLMRFHIPDGEVGGLLEYRYERLYLDPFLVEPWVFANTSPVVRSELGLVPPGDIKLDYIYGHGETRIDRAPERRRGSDGRELLVFAEMDLPGFFHEPLMPHVTRLSPWVAVVLRAARQGEKMTPMDTWKALGDRVFEQMAQVAIAAPEGNVIERYNLVRETLNPLLLPGLGLVPPGRGDALVQGAPASSRDAAAVLLQSFVGADVEAYPALITGPSGPPVYEEMPAFYPFLRALVATRIDSRLLDAQTCSGDYLRRGLLCGTPPGSFLFLDPLCKQCSFGVLPLELMGGRALILDDKGDSWVDMPIDPPQRHAANIHVLWEMDVNGALSGNLVGELRGSQAQTLRSGLLSHKDDNAAHTNLIRLALAGDDGILQVSGGKLIDLDHPELPLGVQAHVASTAERRDRQKFRLRAVDLVGNSIPVAWRPLRRLAAVLEGPMWIETAAEVQLPLGYTADIKRPVKLSSRFAEYAAGFVLRGQELHYSRRFVLKVHTVAAADWADFADFFTQVRDLENDGPTVWEVE